MIAGCRNLSRAVPGLARLVRCADRTRAVCNSGSPIRFPPPPAPWPARPGGRPALISRRTIRHRQEISALRPAVHGARSTP